jgi:hypothetical protein
MTRDEINEYLDSILHIAKAVDRKFAHGSVVFQPWYKEEWEAMICGWGLKPELRATGETIQDALNNLRQVAMNLKSEEAKLAEILGVEYAKAA